MMIGELNLVFNPIRVMLITSPTTTAVSLDKCGLLMHVQQSQVYSRSLSMLLVKWWTKKIRVSVTAIIFPMGITYAQRVNTTTALAVTL